MSRENEEFVVRTMLDKVTMGKKQWAPISIYLDLRGLYRCCFFYFIFLLHFFLVLFLVYISILLLLNLCCKKNLSLLIIVPFFLRQLDVTDVSFLNYFVKCEIYSRFLYFTYTRYYIKFLQNSLNLYYFCETILIYAKLCYITEIMKNWKQLYL